MNNRIANDLIRYAELVEDGALISPEEMNCASVMRLAAEYLAQPAVAEQHKQEPVAYRCRVNGHWSYKSHDVSGLVCEPLYPQRKPLTWEQKEQLWLKRLEPNMISAGACYMMGVQDAEATHGIKEKNTRNGGCL